MERSAVTAIFTLHQVLEEATTKLDQSGNLNARQDSQLLLLHTLQMDRAFLLTHPEDPLTEEQLIRYRQFIARRATREPIQYITGVREFYGLCFQITPDVLIPRPETEHLVEAALDRILIDRPVSIADVGTGSGAIAVALAYLRPMAQITATDLSAAALKVAKMNATTHEVADRIRFFEGNLLDGFDEGSFDIVASNPPYIANSERDGLDAEVKEYEPASALFAGPTGLEIYQRLIPQAARVLRPGGWMLLEIGAGQHLQLQQLLMGWINVSFVPDLQGTPRVAIAQSH